MERSGRIRGKSKKEPEKKKGLSPIRALAVAVGVAVAVVLLVVMWPRGQKVFNRDPADVRREQQENLEKLMDAEISRATARGATSAEIERIRADYQAEIKRRAKE